MPNKHSRRLSLRSWLAALFRQPPAGFYRTPSIYQSGNRLEVEHFRAILLYDEDQLRLQMPARTAHDLRRRAEDPHPHGRPADPFRKNSARGFFR